MGAFYSGLHYVRRASILNPKQNHRLHPLHPCHQSWRRHVTHPGPDTIPTTTCPLRPHGSIQSLTTHSPGPVIHGHATRAFGPHITLRSCTTRVGSPRVAPVPCDATGPRAASVPCTACATRSPGPSPSHASRPHPHLTGPRATPLHPLRLGPGPNCGLDDSGLTVSVGRDEVHEASPGGYSSWCADFTACASVASWCSDPNLMDTTTVLAQAECGVPMRSTSRAGRLSNDCRGTRVVHIHESIFVVKSFLFTTRRHGSCMVPG